MFDSQSKQNQYRLLPDTQKLFSAHEVDRRYLVHSAVLESSYSATAPDESLLPKLVRRRLIRLERVVTSHGGWILRQMPQGLLAAFDTADTAVFGACEMQRCCAVIPKISETQIALKIGIHVAEKDLRSNREIDPSEITAAKLTTLLGDGCVVVSETVIGALSSNLRQIASPIINTGSEISAHQIDWHRAPQARTPLSQVKKHPDANRVTEDTSPSILLRQKGKEHSFGADHRIITIGRDPTNNVTINDLKASRQHCRIIYQGGNYVLVDQSSNGTYITTDQGHEQVVRKSMASLWGLGCSGTEKAVKRLSLMQAQNSEIIVR